MWLPERQAITAVNLRVAPTTRATRVTPVPLGTQALFYGHSFTFGIVTVTDSLLNGESCGLILGSPNKKTKGMNFQK